MAQLTWHNEVRRIKDLIPYVANPRQITEKQAKDLKKSLDKFGLADPLVINTDNTIIGGHQRKKILETLMGVAPDFEVDVRVPDRELTIDESRELNVRLNKNVAGWDFDVLANNFELEDLKEWGFEDSDLDLDLWDKGESEPNARLTLAERFIVPPFSVLDARQGYWQERKRAWINMGVHGKGGSREEGEMTGGWSGSVVNYYHKKEQTEKALGRKLSNKEFNENYVKDFISEDSAMGFTETGGILSLIDPVLCELCYRWFAPAGGLVVNPTAGESTYGLVASYLGYRYIGVEIRSEQVEANIKQNAELGLSANWILGDGQDVYDLVGEDADFIMCCPPYADLEVYSDDPRDLSTMEYEQFVAVYRKIIKESVRRLKDNRFATFIVGDIRDSNGNYRNFVGETINAFIDAGCGLYNEASLVTPFASGTLRAGRQFAIGRKLVKSHQNVLVFIKGDWREAVKACGDVEVYFPDEQAG